MSCRERGLLSVAWGDDDLPMSLEAQLALVRQGFAGKDPRAAELGNQGPSEGWRDSWSLAEPHAPKQAVAANEMVIESGTSVKREQSK